MPWTAKSFKKKHNHSLSSAESLHAAHIANAILHRTGDDSLSIATANKLAHHAFGGMLPRRDDGGMVPTTPETTPGLQPSNQNQTPQAQSVTQRFSAMTAEQLSEIVPRLTGQMQQLAARILQQKRMTPQQAQPSAEATTTTVTPGAQQAFPGGVVSSYASGGATGDETEEFVPILAAGGEFVISPDYARILGDGDIKAGHKLLDSWVVDARKQIVKTHSKLRGPVRG